MRAWPLLGYGMFREFVVQYPVIDPHQKHGLRPLFSDAGVAERRLAGYNVSKEFDNGERMDQAANIDFKKEAEERIAKLGTKMGIFKALLLGVMRLFDRRRPKETPAAKQQQYVSATRFDRQNQEREPAYQRPPFRNDPIPPPRDPTPVPPRPFEPDPTKIRPQLPEAPQDAPPRGLIVPGIGPFPEQRLPPVDPNYKPPAPPAEEQKPTPAPPGWLDHPEEGRVLPSEWADFNRSDTDITRINFEEFDRDSWGKPRLKQYELKGKEDVTLRIKLEEHMRGLGGDPPKVEITMVALSERTKFSYQTSRMGGSSYYRLPGLEKYQTTEQLRAQLQDFPEPVKITLPSNNNSSYLESYAKTTDDVIEQFTKEIKGLRDDDSMKKFIREKESSKEYTNILGRNMALVDLINGELIKKEVPNARKIYLRDFLKVATTFRKFRSRISLQILGEDMPKKMLKLRKDRRKETLIKKKGLIADLRHWQGMLELDLLAYRNEDAEILAPMIELHKRIGKYLEEVNDPAKTQPYMPSAEDSTEEDHEEPEPEAEPEKLPPPVPPAPVPPPKKPVPAPDPVPPSVPPTKPSAPTPQPRGPGPAHPKAPDTQPSPPPRPDPRKAPQPEKKNTGAIVATMGQNFTVEIQRGSNLLSIQEPDGSKTFPVELNNNKQLEACGILVQRNAKNYTFVVRRPGTVFLNMSEIAKVELPQTIGEFGLKTSGYGYLLQTGGKTMGVILTENTTRICTFASYPLYEGSPRKTYPDFLTCIQELEQDKTGLMQKLKESAIAYDKHEKDLLKIFDTFPGSTAVRGSEYVFKKEQAPTPQWRLQLSDGALIADITIDTREAKNVFRLRSFGSDGYEVKCSYPSAVEVQNALQNKFKHMFLSQRDRIIKDPNFEALSNGLERYFGIKKSDVLNRFYKDTTWNVVITRSQQFKQALGGWNHESWQRAKDVAAALNVNIADKFENGWSDYLKPLIDCFYIANEPGAVDVINTITKNNISLNFSFEEKTSAIRLERDKSLILIVAERLRKNGKNATDAGAVEREIESLRKSREESFKNSEELRGPEGSKKPLPIDVLVIQEDDDASNFYGTRIAADLPAMLNLHPNQKSGRLLELRKYKVSENENSKPKTAKESKAAETERKREAARALDDIQLKRKEDWYNGNSKSRHLVVCVISHGSASGAGSSLFLGQDLAKLTDAVGRDASLFYTSCYGGKQVKMLDKKAPDALRKTNVFASVSTTTEPVGLEQFYIEKLKRDAFNGKMLKTQSKEFVDRRGNTFTKNVPLLDINGDGIVTLAEIRYWLDVNTPYQDAVWYNSKGEQLVDANDKRPRDGDAA